MPVSVFIFLIVMVVLVPFLNIFNLQLIERVELQLPSRKKLYLQSALNQIILAALGLWAAAASAITLNYTGNFSTAALISAGAFVTAGFVLSLVSAKNERMREENQGLDMLKPVTVQEKIIWVLVNLVASACEEIMFRGVLYFIFCKTSHNMYLAAIMSATCFGFAHSIQGRAAIVVTIIFGLGLQFLAHINNGLLLPMAAHFMHNMITTFILLRQEAHPVNDADGIPPDTGSEAA